MPDEPNIVVFKKLYSKIAEALRDDLDVPAALAIAEEAGGAAARSLIAVLGLSE